MPRLRIRPNSISCGPPANTNTKQMDNACKLGPRAPRTRGLADEPNGTQLMREDFEGYGFSEEEIEELLRMDELEVDECAQIPHGKAAREKKAQEAKLQQLEKKLQLRKPNLYGKEAYAQDSGDEDWGAPANGRNVKKSQIYLNGSNKKWVLFDHLRGWPPTMDNGPPPVYDRYSRYEPGNSKIVAYNLESCAIALRGTPSMLKHAAVSYTRQGPRIQKVVP